MSLLRKYLCALAALVVATTTTYVSAQNGTMTPYSRYGYGILRDNVSSAQRAMGGVGYAMNSGRQINVMNPASYACCDSLTFLFDMGVDMTNLWQSENVNGKNLSDKQFSGGLDYVTMQFPVSRMIGVSVGLLPYSSVGYAFGSEVDNGKVNRSGDGSINELYAGLGFKTIKGLTVGANFSYMFGTIYNDSYAFPSSGSSTLFERQLIVRDWNLDLGVQYSFMLNRRNRFTLGAVFSPAMDFHGESVTYAYDASQEKEPKEQDRTDLKCNYSRPATWGGGVAWEWDQRLLVEADVTYQPWSKARYKGIEQSDVPNPTLANRTKLALGAQFTPQTRGNYLQRIQYRIGAYYNHDYLNIQGNNLREHGLALGFGMPVPNRKTIVNLGVEWKHRQANPNPLIKEDYINITIGVNFNEMWFNKRKIY